MTEPTLSLPELTSNIAFLEQERMKFPLSDLKALEEKIQFHSARSQVGTREQMAKHSTDLLTTINQKEAAEQNQRRVTEINGQLARLNRDLALARDIEKWANAGEASKLCQQAYDEYVAASKQTARAFRRLLATNRHAGAFPGAIPSPIDAALHLPAVWPIGWTGTVGQAMLSGPLPFETREKEQQ
jgi:hypothetical protein